MVYSLPTKPAPMYYMLSWCISSPHLAQPEMYLVLGIYAHSHANTFSFGYIHMGLATVYFQAVTVPMILVQSHHPTTVPILVPVWFG